MEVVQTEQEHSSDNDLSIQSAETQSTSQAHDNDNNSDDGDIVEAETGRAGNSVDERDNENGHKKTSDQDVGEHSELVSKVGGMKASYTDKDLFDFELEQQLVEARKKQKVKDDFGSGDVE